MNFKGITMQRHLLRAGFLFLGTLCCANVLAGENIATTAVDVKPASEIKVVFHPTVILAKRHDGGSADRGYDCNFYQYEEKLHSFLIYKATPGSQVVWHYPSNERICKSEYFGPHGEKECLKWENRKIIANVVLTTGSDSIATQELAWEGYDLSKYTVTVNGTNVPVSSLPVERSSHRVYRPGGLQPAYRMCSDYDYTLRGRELARQADWFDYSY